MNWYKNAIERMPIPQALETLGFPSNSTPSPDEVQRQYRQLARKYHPDVNPTATETMKTINDAYDSLRGVDLKNIDPTSYQQRPVKPQTRETPPWQTDPRSTYNEVNREEFTDLNYAKKAIYENAVQYGDTEPITIWAFDGTFFRGVFTVNANDQSLGFAGLVMETWNSKGGNPYPTEAVFAGGKKLKLIRLKGQDVSDQNITFEHDAFNNNPANDPAFLNKIRNYVKSASLDVIG